MDKATFGAGCFWHVEAKFREIPGVISTRVGYAGGITPNPTYEQVCRHTTGHAEVVEITFDPDQVSYGRLLTEFWMMHDPTQVDRQGPDIGSNYRSIILAHDDGQRALAEAAKAGLGDRSPKPIATEIADAGTFYEAEDYHQQYFEKKGIASCAVTVMNAAGS
jgi:peptide-methionine (S)-S-oxide reductase